MIPMFQSDHIQKGFHRTALTLILLASLLVSSLPVAEAQASAPELVNASGNSVFNQVDSPLNVAGVNFNSNFNSNASGWASVYGSWALSGSAFYTTLGVAKASSSIKHIGAYTNFTYQARLKQIGMAGDSGIFIRGDPTHLTGYKDWVPSIYFTYTNSGMFSIWKVGSTSGGVYDALKTWTTSAAIAKNGWNILKVVAIGPSLKFYVNNKLVWSGSSVSPSTGQVGIYMYRGSSPVKLCVDWATLSTVATAKINSDEQIFPGVEAPGGGIHQAP